MDRLEWFIARVNARSIAEMAERMNDELRQINAEETYASLIEREGDKFKVQVYASTNIERLGQTHLLNRDEIMGPSAEIGLRGKLELKDKGMHVSYHLIPNET